MRLPSERYWGGDLRPIGFEYELSPSLVSRTIGAMEEIAAEVTMAAGRPALSVCLTSVALVAGLPFNLYGFALYGVDDDGPIVTATPDQEIRYAIIANQPVDLQREAAIRSTARAVRWWRSSGGWRRRAALTACPVPSSSVTPGVADR